MGVLISPGIGKAFATASGSGGLHAEIQGDDWNFLLRRVDFMFDRAFARHYGNEIFACDIAVFLPNWRSLSWKSVPPDFQLLVEVCAVDNEYRVNVVAWAGSKKSHQDLISAFLRFMQPPGI